MSPIRRFDHVGITVADFGVVTGFFVGLGLETEGRTVLEGEFLDTVTGIHELAERDRRAVAAGRRNRAGAGELQSPQSRTGIA